MIMAIEHSGILITVDSIKTKLLEIEVAAEKEREVNGAFATRSKFTQRKTTNLSIVEKTDNVFSTIYQSQK